MKLENFSEAIPLYNDIKAVKVSIEKLEKLKKQPFTRLIIEGNPGIDLPGKNFAQDAQDAILSLLLSIKERQLKDFEIKFDSL